MNRPLPGSIEPVNISNDKEISYANTLVKEIISSPANKGKLAHKFDKSINKMNNNQLIEVAEYLGQVIQSNGVNEPILESMLDKVLEKIEGSLE
jgi:hypothetical protein